MIFVSELSKCPKKIEKLVLKYSVTPTYGQLPSLCYASVVSVQKTTEGKLVERVLLNTVFTAYDLPPIMFLKEISSRIKATIKTLPTPKDCYEVHISNSFLWALMIGIAKSPSPSHLKEHLMKPISKSERPWKFYFDNSSTMKDTGDFVFREYTQKLRTGPTGISHPNNFKSKFDEELEMRQQFNYVR